jgi:hypothetical protein
MTQSTLRKELNTILSKINKLDCKICVIDGQIVIIENRLGLVEADILTINTTLGDHETRITTLEGGFTQTINVVNQYSDIPAPNLATGEFYFTQNSQGAKWLPGSWGGTYYPGGVLYYSTGVAWITSEMPWEATQADVNAGVVTDEFVSPATLASATTVSHPGHTHTVSNVTDYVPKTTNLAITFAIALG